MEIAASAHCWQDLAPGWERWAGHLADGMAPVRAWLVRELAPTPSAVVLELSCGAGETGLAVARKLIGGGRLIASDAAPAMVELARRRSTAAGVTNIEHRVLDAQAIELPDDAVDGVVCQNGYMLLDDPAAALAQTRRVLRPGGRVALSVWADVERQHWAEASRAVLVEQGRVDPRVEELPDPADLRDPARVDAMLRAAGFTSVKTDEVPIRFRFADLDELVGWSLDISAVADVLHALDERARAAWRSRLAEVVAPWTARDGSLALPGVSLVSVAA